jgi:hypothetical protein
MTGRKEEYEKGANPGKHQEHLTLVILKERGKDDTTN